MDFYSKQSFRTHLFYSINRAKSYFLLKMELLRQENNFLQIEQSVKMKNLRTQGQKKQEQVLKAEALPAKKQQGNSVNNSITLNESLDLDKLILCQHKQVQVNQSFNQKEPLLILGKSKKMPPQSFDLFKGFQTKQQQLEKEISSGILKLQSDQVKKQAVDFKLQEEELAIIEEDIRSNRQTVNQRHFQWRQKKKQKGYAPFQRKNQLFRNNLEEQCLQYQKQKKFQESKNFIQWFIIILFISIFFAGILQNKIPIKHKRIRK